MKHRSHQAIASRDARRPASRPRRFASRAPLPRHWPAKPISLIVPFAAGGTTDVLARAIGQELSKSLGQPVIVESKPGAGATLGADFVAKSKPDGYTLLMGAVHHTIATSVYKKLPTTSRRTWRPSASVALGARTCSWSIRACPPRT